jgi:hypothetical protein
MSDYDELNKAFIRELDAVIEHEIETRLKAQKEQ